MKLVAGESRIGKKGGGSVTHAQGFVHEFKSGLVQGPVDVLQWSFTPIPSGWRLFHGGTLSSSPNYPRNH